MKANNKIANIFLLVFSLLLSFGIAEWGVRKWAPPPMQVIATARDPSNSPTPGPQWVRGMPDALYQYTPEGGVRLTPNASFLIKNNWVSHRDIPIRTNSLGFRGPEPSEFGEATYRILVLGDSITLGDYVLESETYPKQLETRLREQSAKISVINAGVGSNDIRNEFQILKETVGTIKPNLVFIGLYLNDGELSSNMVIQPLPTWLRFSHLLANLNRQAQIAWYRFRHRHELSGSNGAWQEQFKAQRKIQSGNWIEDPAALNDLILKNTRDWGAAWDPKTWEIVELYLTKIQKLQKEHGFELAVVLFPVRFQVEAEYLAVDPQKSFAKLMDRLSIPHFDLLPVLRQSWQENTESPLYYDRCHLTPRGNALVGEALAQFLRNSPVTLVSEGATQEFSPIQSAF